jgi:hypothetical protein
VIAWKKVPRKGFIPAHWVGLDEAGRECFKIDQRKPISAGRRHNTRHALLFRMPNGGCVGTYDNVAAAKAAATV